MKLSFKVPRHAPKYTSKKCLFIILGVMIIFSISLFLQHVRLQRVLYVTEALPTGMPPEDVPSAQVERERLEKLYHATHILYTVLNRTGHTKAYTFYTVSSVLKAYKKIHWERQQQNLQNLPYRIKSQDELSEMLVASDVLLTHAQNYGIKHTQIHFLYHQLAILWQREFPRQSRKDECNRCMEYNFRNIIKPHNICGGESPIEFVSLITSVPNNILERQAVRTTWGAFSQRNTGVVRHVFLFGGGWSEEESLILQKENRIYGDILQDDFKDNYYNLTYKVLMGYHWAVKECKRAKFIMRAADDAYIYVPRVLNLIANHGQEDGMQQHQVGLCFKEFTPYRLIDYKGYLSRLEYGRDTLPTYALGTNFLTSMRLSEEILSISPDVPFFSVEDAYFGLVLYKLHRGCYHLPTFVGQYFPYTPRSSYLRHCNILPWFTHHSLSPSMMLDIHAHCVLPDVLPRVLLYLLTFLIFISIVWYIKTKK